MSKVSNNYQLSEIVTVSVLKKKFKQYLSDAQHEGFKSSVFPKYLVISLVMVLEEILSDCLEYVKKHETTGLYVVDYSMVQMVLNKNNKYDFSLKYFKKYNTAFKYQDSVFFTYRKVVDNLESKYGDKLMIESDAKNFIAHIISSLQYDLIEMALTMVVYSNRKTLSSESLLCSYGILFKEMHSKIKLKLDSLMTTKAGEEAEEAEEEGEAEGEAEGVDAEGTEETETEAEPETVEVKTAKGEAEAEAEAEVEGEKTKPKVEKVKDVQKVKEFQKVSKKNVEIVEEDDLEKELENELPAENKDTQMKAKPRRVVKK